MSQIEMTAINKKIDQTRAELENLKTCHDVDMRAIMAIQLEARLDALLREKEEMEASAAKDTVTLRIYGEDVQPGKISSRILLSALNGFQSMLDAVANAMLHSPTSRGKIPERIKEITSLEVVDTFAGSFGIVLEKPNPQQGFTSDDSGLSGILSEMFSVLETVDNNEQLLSNITPFGQRTVTNYRQWLEDLKENNVNLELNWKNESAASRRMHLMKEKAPSIISMLDTIDKIDNEDVVLVGILNGVNIRSHSFEMSVEGYGLVKGNALPETLMGISDKLGTEVCAHTVKSISYTKAGVQKASWFLSSID